MDGSCLLVSSCLNAFAMIAGLQRIDMGLLVVARLSLAFVKRISFWRRGCLTIYFESPPTGFLLGTDITLTEDKVKSPT